MIDGDRPVSEIFPGLPIEPLPKGETLLAALLFVKTLAEDGTYEWSSREIGEGMARTEILGVAEGLAAAIEADLAGRWGS